VSAANAKRSLGPDGMKLSQCGPWGPVDCSEGRVRADRLGTTPTATLG
jgi:hypothetical protein